MRCPSLARVVPALLLPLFAQAARAAAPAADAIVAADGSGRYTSIQQAISEAPMDRQDGPRWIIRVKPGVYHERVYVQRERGNILLEGDDAATTIVRFDLHARLPGPDGLPIGTFRTPTVQIDGDGFQAENLTFANGAGPVGQAVAVRVDADRVVFRHCRFLGWQDTLLLNRGRQYLADCYIEGHVDFIFGGATAFFNRCDIHCLRDGYITAASTPAEQRHGFVFADGRITGAPGVHTFLGRPWRDFAATAFVRTAMSDVVRPAGWNDWGRPRTHETARYAEFECSGPGAARGERVHWERRLESGGAATLTPQAVLAGADGWDPEPGPTLHLAGDSTMADKPDLEFPERGWGQALRTFVRAPWQLVNHAVNGRSTKSFRTLGDWDELLRQLRPGDWVLVEFGHNDEKKADPARYADPEHDYPENLRRFVREVRARGASPILATPISRRAWTKEGALRDTHAPYSDAVRRVAREENVPLADLEARTREWLLQLGPAASEHRFMNFNPGELPLLPQGRHDNTHLTQAGAEQVAQLAIAEITRVAPALSAAFAVAPRSVPGAAAPHQ